VQEKEGIMKRAARRARGVAAGVVVVLAASVAAWPARGQDLAGTGEWQSRSGEGIHGTWTVALTRSHDDLAGTIELTGSTLFSGGTVSGAIDGENVMFGVLAEGTEQVKFSGQLAGETITGEWECPAINDRGTWKGTMRGR
jgi:hypothetical protein